MLYATKSTNSNKFCIVEFYNKSIEVTSLSVAISRQRSKEIHYQFINFKWNDAKIYIIDTRLVQVGLEVDADLMIGGMSSYHHNKVINIIANLHCMCGFTGNLTS